jgi:hypothetical protein
LALAGPVGSAVGYQGACPNALAASEHAAARAVRAQNALLHLILKKHNTQQPPPLPGVSSCVLVGEDRAFCHAPVDSRSTCDTFTILLSYIMGMRGCVSS